MRFRYTEWDGTEFPTQDRIGSIEGLLEIFLAYGERALDALEHLPMDDEHRQWLDQLLKDGMLEKIGAKWRLTPRAVSSMQRKALMEVFRGLRNGGGSGHETTEIGPGGERTDGTKRYEYGDPISEVDVGETLRNAVVRGGPGLPIRVHEDDFELHRSETRADCSVILLLDMSGSMGRYGRFYNAKKCAMAMHALIRQRFPQDTVDIVGFFSTAEVIPEHRLPLIMPKPVTIFDSEVRLRLPLGKAADAPQHFTNLQMGIALARQVLRRRRSRNKQIFIITDGEPTAHVEGDHLYLLYPPDRRSAIATLNEAFRAYSEGVRISTFALIEEYAYMEWVGFVDQLTKLTKGVAFYCHSGDLSSCIMESYLSGKKRKEYIA